MQNVVGQLFGNPAVTTALTVIAAGVAALWLAAAWWTYQDMQRRTTSELAALGAVAWILLSTPAALPLSLPIYLLARPQLTVAQGRSKTLTLALEAELSDAVECPGCGRLGQPDWKRCPTCATWLAVECDSCGRWSGVELDICPWCAHERPAAEPVGVVDGSLGSPVPAPRIAADGLAPVPVGRPEPARRRPTPARLG